MWPSKEALSVCEDRDVSPCIPHLEGVLGLSDKFDPLAKPINGLRHPETGNANGWYIWTGSSFPTRDDAFKPFCLKHLAEQKFRGLRFLCLPPGWRFLLADDYVDVWFDESLLKVD